MTFFVLTMQIRNAGLLQEEVECDTLYTVPNSKYPNNIQKK